MHSIAQTSTTAPSAEGQHSTQWTALYRLLDDNGAPLYIGITSDPDRRFKQHRDDKQWWPQVASKTVEWYRSRNLAFTEEAVAIATEAPAHNIRHNPGAQRPVVNPDTPPAGMPSDRVDALRRAASALPADLGQAVLRAGFESFLLASAKDLDAVTAPLPAALDHAMRKTLPEKYSPEVADALKQMDEQEQEARAAGLWDANYERMHVELGKMFVETNSVGPVLDVCFQAMCNSIAEQHGLRLTRAAEDASDQLDGKILVWRESGIVILPHDMTPLDALDQLRAAVGETAGK